MSDVKTERLAPGVCAEAYEMVVERGKIREFARATHATDPSYDGGRPVIPPTFLTTSAFWTGPESSVLRNARLPWGRLLSGGADYVFHGPPIEAGTRLTVQEEIRDVYTKVGRRAGEMTFIAFTVSFRRDDGALAAEEHHLTIVTPQPPNSPAESGVRSAEAPGLAKSPGPTDRPGRFPAGALRSGEDLPGYVEEPVSRTGIVRYQGASGDLNPIHHDDGFAQRAGYPTAFSVGMYHAGILGSYLADLVGPAAVRRLRVEFREQVWPGDVLRYAGRVVAREGDEWRLGLQVTLPNGRAQILGSAMVADS